MLARFQESISVIVLNQRMAARPHCIKQGSQMGLTVWPSWSHILQLSPIYDSWSQVLRLHSMAKDSWVLPRVEVVKPGPKQGVFVPIAKGNLALHCELHRRGRTKRNRKEMRKEYQISCHLWTSRQKMVGDGRKLLHATFTLGFDQLQTPQQTEMSCNSWWKSRKGCGVLSHLQHTKSQGSQDCVSKKLAYMYMSNRSKYPNTPDICTNI